MDEEIGMELTLGNTSVEEVDLMPDSAADDDVMRIVESKSESPIAGVVVSDEAERSERRDGGGEDSDGDDFEFTFAGVDSESDWLPPGEVFPIFDRRLLSETEALAIQNDQLQTVQSALKNLFVVDHDRDDETEMDGIAPGSYCVWTPGNSPQASPARCKKSSSTGSTAKRWTVSLRELLIRRSRSDGKGSLVRFGSWKKAERGTTSTVAAKVGGGEKRRQTYLPYKKAIVGFGFYPRVTGFGGVNTNRPPF